MTVAPLKNSVSYAMLAGAFGLSSAVGSAVASAAGAPLKAALASGAVSAGLALLVVFIGRGTLGKRGADLRAWDLFEQLVDALSSAKTAEEVVRAVENAIKRALVCEYVELQTSAAARLPDLARRTEARGAQPTTSERREEPISLSVAFGDKQLGTLHVCLSAEARENDGAAALLGHVAKLSALGLAHASARHELEQKRNQTALAWRGEREALLETVAAEIAHEVRYPINFFHSVFERANAGEPLGREDLDIGREEVQRLERLVSGLRRVAVRKREVSAIAVSELFARAEALVREAFVIRRLNVSVERDFALQCDEHQATQILVNLLTNAIEAAGPDGNVELEFKVTEAGGELTVSDDGPGFQGDPARLFVPWYTTKVRGSGLGLAITHRLVRGHGWTISAARAAGRTVFTIAVRPGDIASMTGKNKKFVSQAEVA